MTKDGKWGLIFQNQGAPVTPPPGGGDPNLPNQGGKNPPDHNGQGGQSPQNPEGGEGGLDVPKNGEVVATGPITGVYSKSNKKSHLILYGHEHYNEWLFTDNLITGTAPGVGPRPAGGRLQFSTRWLGRPMQFVDQAQPQNGTLPGQTGTGSTGTTPPTTPPSGKP
jgi:hypothetical protein